MRKVEPSPIYEHLVRQFSAAMTLVWCLEQRLAVYQKEQIAENHARQQLDSERAANARLTAEIDALKAELELYVISGKPKRQSARR